MLTAMAMAMLCGAEGSNMVWLNAYEAGNREVVLEDPGTYHVWVWLGADGPGIVTLGRKSLKAKPGKDADAYAWVEAGKVNLDAGTVDLALEGPVAAVALSRDDAFDPANAMADVRVSDQPVAVGDTRAAIERDTNTRFEMTPFTSLDDWEPFAAALRRRILVSSGLWPLHERTPLNAEVSVVAEHEDYVVERVRLEAFPGFYVTGNLYRPPGEGPYPGIACPHGHWGTGRLVNKENGSVAARCITFARMGMVALSYDMVGYNDSLQLDHGLKKDGKALSKAEVRQLELWGIHPFAVQLWSSIRVVDYLEGLPYVDPDRLACTGASGGGTQTFALTAIDPRIKVAAPVNMISHSMQGGCMCENAPIIRHFCSNMEIGALAAPRPLLMVSASGDWTAKTPEVEYPAIRSVYALYGNEARVENAPFDAPHNYNLDSREAVYRFFGKWILDEGDTYARFEEPAWEMEPDDALLIFPDKKLPENAPSRDAVLDSIREASRAKCAAVLPADPASATAFRNEYGPALADVLGMKIPDKVLSDVAGQVHRQGYTVAPLVLSREDAAGQVPALHYSPIGLTDHVKQRPVLVVHGDGKAALADLANGGPGPLVRSLLESGRDVMVIDPFLTGEHHSPMQETHRKNKKFPDTFLPTTTAYRVQDIVTALTLLGAMENAESPDVIGLGEAGMWCLLASAVSPNVGKTVIDTNQFANTDDTAWVEQCYVPCIRSIGDVATAAALIAPRELTVFNTGGKFDASEMARVYEAAAGQALPVDEGDWTPNDIIAALTK